MRYSIKALVASKYGGTLLVLAGLIVFCCLPLAWLSLYGEVAVDLYPFYEAHVTNIQPCNGLDAKTGLPVEAKESFHSSDERLDVCAHLAVDYVGPKGYPVPLHFLWRYEGKAIYVSSTRMYSPGYITGSLKRDLAEPFRPGIYRVEIRARRSEYGATELSVVP
jgi:hypothetical protein